MAFEDPVAELAADRHNVAEESVLLEAVEFDHAGEPELVLDDSVFHAGVTADLVEFVGVFGFDRGRLFAIDVLAGGCGLFDGFEAAEG